MSSLGWGNSFGRSAKDKSKFLDPVKARDEHDRPCRKCHEDAGTCICVAFCGVMVCTGAKEEEPDE